MVDESDHHHHRNGTIHPNDDDDTRHHHSSSTPPNITTTRLSTNVDDNEINLQYSDMMYAIDSFYTIVQPGT